MKKSRCCRAEVIKAEDNGKVYGYVCEKCSKECDTIEEVQNEEKVDVSGVLYETKLSGMFEGEKMITYIDHEGEIKNATVLVEGKKPSPLILTISEAISKASREEKKTATELMVNDMQEEEYYRIKHTPTQPEKEWKEIEEIISDMVNHLSDEIRVDYYEEHANKLIKETSIKIQSLLSQKDREWERKLKNDYIKLSSEEYVDGWRRNDRASGGKHYINKRLDKEIFIDYSGGARIMKIGEGRWEKSIKVNKSDKLEDIIKELLK